MRGGAPAGGIPRDLAGSRGSHRSTRARGAAATTHASVRHGGVLWPNGLALVVELGVLDLLGRPPLELDFGLRRRPLPLSTPASATQGTR